MICNGLPEGGNATWNATCSGRPAGANCTASCAAGTSGLPLATCGPDGRWLVSGSCTQGDDSLLARDSAVSRACISQTNAQPMLLLVAAGAVVTCAGTPGSGSNATSDNATAGNATAGSATWPAACSNRTARSTCVGVCPANWITPPTATCGTDGRWVVTGACTQGTQCSSCGLPTTGHAHNQNC